MKISAFIICWPGKEKNAQYIAKCIFKYVDQLVTIYSTKDNSLVSGAGKWVKVPDEWYYGKKFKKTLELNKCDSMIHIHADAYSDNWIKLVKNFKQSINLFPNLGIWMPKEKIKLFDSSNIFHRRFKNTKKINFNSILDIIPKVEINNKTIETNRFIFSCQTDTTIWAITKKVISRLKKINYNFNNLGWGIDSFALAYSYSNNLLVIRDNSSTFKHDFFKKRISNYSHANALIQMNYFFKQLTLQEKIILKLANDFFISTLKKNSEKKN
jgi:hypothetical protein